MVLRQAADELIPVQGASSKLSLPGSAGSIRLVFLS